MTVAQLAQAPQKIVQKLDAEAKDVCLPHLEEATQPYVVDQSKGPHAGLFSRTAFNAYYMLRHYLGPKRGLYGPESTRGFLKRLERRVEDIDREPRPSQVCRDVKQPQGGVGLHDFPLFLVFAEKVAVGEKDVGQS